MKATVTKTISTFICDFCRKECSMCCLCLGCRKDICYDCRKNETNFFRYPSNVGFETSQDGLYCAGCVNDPIIQQDTLLIAYQLNKKLLIKSKEDYESFRARTKAISEQIKLLRAERNLR